jgi:hypothetical protein
MAASESGRALVAKLIIVNMMMTHTAVATAAPTPAYTRCMSSNISRICTWNEAFLSARARLTTAAERLASCSSATANLAADAARRAARTNRNSANDVAQAPHHSRCAPTPI